MAAESKIQEIIDQQKKRDAENSETESSNEDQYIGVWKGAHREINERYLDLRFRDGQRTAFDYPDRKFVNYNPEIPCIDMDFGGNLVTIIGRNIERVYELLLHRKVEWLKEVDTEYEDDGSEDVYIEHILITPEGGLPEEQK